jgi:hypothetical protein
MRFRGGFFHVMLHRGWSEVDLRGGDATAAA